MEIVFYYTFQKMPEKWFLVLFNLETDDGLLPISNS